MPDCEHCANSAKNAERCTCSNQSCERHGVCCECIAFHLAQKNLPQCCRQMGL